MPILPENKHLYPDNWSELSKYIRFIRDKNRCKFCSCENYKPHPITGSKVILSVAHLDHDPTNNSDDNLASICQRCHNRYDLRHRLETRRNNKFRRLK